MPSEILARDTSHFVCVGDKRIFLYRHGSVFLRAPVVVETEFGYRPEKIGLREIWFCRYDLIEILNREYIVFKIERILTYAEHLVSVDLGFYGYHPE